MKLVITFLAFLAFDASATSYTLQDVINNKTITAQEISSPGLLAHEGVCFSGDALSAKSALAQYFATKESQASKTVVELDGDKITLNRYRGVCSAYDNSDFASCKEFTGEYVFTNSNEIQNCTKNTKKYFPYSKETIATTIEKKVEVVKDLQYKDIVYKYDVSVNFYRNMAYVEVKLGSEIFRMKLDSNKVLTHSWNTGLPLKGIEAYPLERNSTAYNSCSAAKDEGDLLVACNSSEDSFISGLKIPAWVFGLEEVNQEQVNNGVKYDDLKTSYSFVSSSNELKLNQGYSSVKELWRAVSVRDADKHSVYCVAGSFENALAELVSCGVGCASVYKGLALSNLSLNSNYAEITFKGRVCRDDAEKLPAKNIDNYTDCSESDKYTTVVDVLRIKSCN